VTRRINRPFHATSISENATRRSIGSPVARIDRIARYPGARITPEFEFGEKSSSMRTEFFAFCGPKTWTP
jgi:hypothetical protein